MTDEKLTAIKRGFRARLDGWLERHAQVSVASIGRLYSRPLATLMVWLVIGVALALPALLQVVVRNLEAVGPGQGRAYSIDVFLKPKLGTARVQQVAERVGARDDVARVELITAEQGLAEIAGVVDTVISIPNDKLLKLAGKNTSFQEALQLADDVLRQAVQGIADIITTPGIINRDFSDIRAIMSGMGYAMMGTATATGEDAAIEAARQAINSPLLEEGGVEGARGILINITGSSRLGLLEVSEACTLVREATQNDDVQISFGVVADESMDETVKLTVIATGFERQTLPQIQRRKTPGSQPIAVDPALFLELPKPPIAPIERELFAETELDTPEAVWVAPPQAAEPATTEAPKPADPFDDVDTPAFLRRERRLFR